MRFDALWLLLFTLAVDLTNLLLRALFGMLVGTSAEPLGKAGLNITH